MSYIGNTPFTAAFLTDTFSGNGTTVAFTMSVAPANTSSILVAVTGVVQDPSTYSVSGTTLTFSAAPPSGTSNISVRYLGIPASGVTTTAYRTQTEFTATAGQTTFTVPSYTVGFIDVYRNGLLLGSSDFTATTGTTVVLANAASAGDFIETVSFYVSSVLNAIQQYNGLSVNQVLTSPTANTLTSASGSNLQLQTNGGTTAMTFDTAQNAGLGVTPSAWSGQGGAVLELGNGAHLFGASASFVQLGANAYYNGSNYIYKGSSFASRYLQNNGQHIWYNAATGTAGNAITFTQAMTLDASGNLGIGTTSFTRRVNFAIADSTAYNSSSFEAAPLCTYIRNTDATIGSYAGLQFAVGSNGDAAIAGVRTADASCAITFGTRNVGSGSIVERARIDSSGNLLVGTTSIADSNGAKFVVNATFPVTPVELRQSSTSSHYQITFRNSNGLVGNITSSGSSTSYNTSSDYRLKENIAPMTGALAKVAALKPCTYTWKADGTYGEGFIAHELADVVPDAVTGEKDAVNQDGSIKPQSIDTSFLVATLTAAIQELKTIVDAQSAEIAALKGQA